MLKSAIEGIKYPSDTLKRYTNMEFDECVVDECKFINECWQKGEVVIGTRKETDKEG